MFATYFFNSSSLTLFFFRQLQHIQVSSKTYIPNTTIIWQEHFEDIIGVTKFREETLQTIKLWFHPTTAPYIISKPIHGSQKVIQQDEHGLIIQIELIPNYEFYQQILFYGKQVKILSPLFIQQKVIGILEESLSNYIK